jgi:hypothetical protein
MVSAHDTPSSSINDSSLKGMQPSSTQLPLTTMNGSGVQSLFGDTESNEMLHHRRDIVSLYTLNVAIGHFS